ncbi:DUF883 domain-containing protein [Salinicola corii]|uniref:DUF883 domain-containing protein n=1 Tax=Salinicola corii TaxID=2606937 RepID=A0A640WK39_9GAMM|nr:MULTISPECIES: DUF883 family protein [Salinicola]KAA0020935.1 DUF883 domain-containing protein [Salinicola corii]MAM56889.1 hypothetical protein [Salinicola sp.]NRB58206.1 DUF883 domain-containing protein [Salinicola sp.]
MTMQSIGGNGPEREREASTEQLKEDLRNLSHTVEELIHATADDSRSNISEMRERAQQRLHATRERLEARGEALYSSAKEQVDATDRYVHENPWTSIGIGAAAGVVLGLLLGRR